MDLSAITKLNPIPVVPMDKTNIAKMREWASEHGQCVRQLTVRQQTTKFSAGTLPLLARVGYKPTTRSSQQQCGQIICDIFRETFLYLKRRHLKKSGCQKIH